MPIHALPISHLSPGLFGIQSGTIWPGGLQEVSIRLTLDYRFGLRLTQVSLLYESVICGTKHDESIHPSVDPS